VNAYRRDEIRTLSGKRDERTHGSRFHESALVVVVKAVWTVSNWAWGTAAHSCIGSTFAVSPSMGMRVANEKSSGGSLIGRARVCPWKLGARRASCAAVA